LNESIIKKVKAALKEVIQQISLNYFKRIYNKYKKSHYHLFYNV